MLFRARRVQVRVGRTDQGPFELLLPKRGEERDQVRETQPTCSSDFKRAGAGNQTLQQCIGRQASKLEREARAHEEGGERVIEKI